MVKCEKSVKFSNMEGVFKNENYNVSIKIREIGEVSLLKVTKFSKL